MSIQLYVLPHSGYSVVGYLQLFGTTFALLCFSQLDTFQHILEMSFSTSSGQAYQLASIGGGES